MNHVKIHNNKTIENENQSLKYINSCYHKKAWFPLVIVNMSSLPWCVLQRTCKDLIKHSVQN